jgi:hypothetical protein
MGVLDTDVGAAVEAGVGPAGLVQPLDTTTVTSKRHRDHL